MASKPKLIADQQFKIIKNVPPPSGHGDRQQYPFGDMVVGDAFDAPRAITDRLRAAASSYGRANGKKFSVRKLDENTLRVWRIA
jgi:hypothetical protein